MSGVPKHPRRVCGVRSVVLTTDAEDIRIEDGHNIGRGMATGRRLAGENQASTLCQVCQYVRSRAKPSQLGREIDDPSKWQAASEPRQAHRFDDRVRTRLQVHSLGQLDRVPAGTCGRVTKDR